MSAEEGRQTFTTSDGREIQRPRKKQAKVPTRYQKLIDGELSVEDLTDEELYRGMLQDSRGVIRGNPPKAIPWVMHKAAMDHVAQRVERTIVGSMPDIVEALIDIATNQRDTDAGVTIDTRAKAQMYLLDRILGRPTEKQQVDVNVHAKWEKAFEGGDLFVDIPEADIVDAELVDEDTEQSSLPALPAAALVERSSPEELTRAGREDGAEGPKQSTQPRPPRPKTGVKLK